MGTYNDFVYKTPSKKEEVIEFLEIAGEEGLLNTELRQLSLRFTGIIHLLRNEGYIIESVREGGQIFRYILRGKKDPVEEERPFDVLMSEIEKRGSVSAEEFSEILSSKNLVLKRLVN